MSGHSKWSTIKRQKGITDHKRGQVFTRLSRAISMAVKEGGGTTDPGMNFKLRLAMEKAREANMPKANIERAIDQGAGKGGGANMETVLYEGYGPEGIAVMVESVTDNKQRSFHEIRQLFERGGGTLGQLGTVGYLFDHVGWIYVVVPDQNRKDELMLEMLDIEGILDFEAGDEGIDVYTEHQKLKAVHDELVEKKLQPTEFELIMKAKDPLSLESEALDRVTQFIGHLEDSDEVQRVFVNVAL